MEPKPEEKKSNDELKILEWRFNQFLGEKLTNEQIKQLRQLCQSTHLGTRLGLTILLILRISIILK